METPQALPNTRGVTTDELREAVKLRGLHYHKQTKKHGRRKQKTRIS